MTWHLFQIGMDETNKRINNMVVEGLEKAGLATNTKLSGGCQWSLLSLSSMVLYKALKSSWSGSCGQSARAHILRRESVSRRQRAIWEQQTPPWPSLSCFSNPDWLCPKKGFASTEELLVWQSLYKTLQALSCFSLWPSDFSVVNRSEYKTWAGLLPRDYNSGNW